MLGLFCGPHMPVLTPHCLRVTGVVVVLAPHFVCFPCMCAAAVGAVLQEDADDILADNAEDLGGEDLGGSAAHYR
jgi:hypothetical protein